MPAAEPLSDPTSPLGQRIRALAEGGRAKRTDEILVEEEPNVLAAHRAGIAIHHLLVTREPSGALADLATSVPTTSVTGAALAELFPRTRAPRAFAITALPEASRFRDLEDRPGDLVVLEDLAGPGNIGAVVRCAAAFGAAGVLVLGATRAELYRRGIIRAAAGTIFSLPLLGSTTEQFVKFCRASGTRIVATSSHAPGDFDVLVASPGRLALVLGSEAEGCSPQLEAAADLRCRIPMDPAVESLNVSAAASVLLFARSRWVDVSLRPG